MECDRAYCTHCASRQARRHDLASDCLQLKWSKQITPCAPGPISAAQQQREKGDSVRGVDMCRSCIDEGDGNTADTGIYRGGELQAARTVPQRTGHGAPKAAPKLETQRLALEPPSTFQG